MTTPTPIAFEPAAKSAPSRRETASRGDSHSFADTMQAQRAADRSGAAAAQSAAEPTQTRREQTTAVPATTGKNPAPGHGERQTGADSGSRADKTAAAQAKTDANAPQGRAGEQAAAKAADAAAKLAATGTEKSGQAAAKTAAADGPAAHARTLAAAKAGQASTQQATTHQTGAQQTSTQQPGAAGALARGDGQPVQAIVQSVAKGQARPVNSATAVAAHTAATAATAAKDDGQAVQKARTAEAAASKTASADAKAADDPTAKALRDALTGGRETATTRRGEDTTDPHAPRTETRPTGQRAAGGGMSPALRAAAEAVQQQLTGGTGPTATAGAAGAGTQPPNPPQARTDAGALPAQGQTFDPVLQNTGPQPGGAGQPGSLAAAGKAAPSAGTGSGNPAPSAPPVEQVAVQIQRAAAQGQSRVQIRLNPAELGRIDVKLEVGDDGHVRAALSVDKPETLDLMQRDPRALERALQAAGLKTDPGSLSFNLRDDGTGHGENAGGDGRDRPDGTAGSMTGQSTGDTPIPAEPLRASLPADGRVDIRV